jgi:hypothetical protein
MTSFKQIDANRRNARKSTGPITEEGKQRSRCNAVRHGLTAETVIGALEDAEDYKAFEAAIIADYNVQSAVERELVLRLASLLWRLQAPPPWKPACSKSRLTNSVRSVRAVKLNQSRRKSSMQDSARLNLSVPTPIEQRTASQTGRKPGPALS